MKREWRIVMAAVGLIGGTAWAQVTQRVNIATDGTQSNAFSFGFSMSADGRLVAFASAATNLIPSDGNAVADVFVHDRQLGTTTRSSLGPGGVEANGGSQSPSISADGRYVAFASVATNLVPGDTNGIEDIFVRDRATGTTARINVGVGGVQSNGASSFPTMSSDGRFVGFRSLASNLVPGDTNGLEDGFLYDRLNGTTERVNLPSGGGEANGAIGGMSVSADGRFVTFDSSASNLVSGDTNGFSDAFLRDRLTGTTERLSVDSAGMQALLGDSSSGSISSDGRYVIFGSLADNLVPGDTNAASDVFLRDRATGTTVRVSVDVNGQEGGLPTFAGPLTPDGRYTVMSSYCTFIPGDTNGAIDVFLRDLSNGSIERVNLSSAGAEANAETWGGALSDDGRFVAFWGSATNLVPGDTNLNPDIFVRDRLASGFTNICDPGIGGVIPCPCSNPPSGPGRGCDNSSLTGGAALSASGIAYLGMDDLVFSTSGEKPDALSIVLQGDAELSTGVGFGQGVRCVGGVLKRLFTKTATGGSITAPEFTAGDPSVSLRSAQKGDTILAGASRFYTVYYRETSVGCLGGQFNATQTARVVWSL